MVRPLKALGIAEVRKLILTNLQGTPRKPIGDIIAYLPRELAREVIFGEGNNLGNVIELVTSQDFEVIAALAEAVEDKAILCNYNVRFDRWPMVSEWPRVKQVMDLAKEQGQIVQLVLNKNGDLLECLIVDGQSDFFVELIKQSAVEGWLREVCAIRRQGWLLDICTLSLNSLNPPPRSLVDIACAMPHMIMAQSIFDAAKANGMVRELVTPTYFVVECSKTYEFMLLKLALIMDAASNDQELTAAMRVAAQAHFLPEQPFNVAMLRCNNVMGGIYRKLLLEQLKQPDVVKLGQSPNVAAIKAMMSVCHACALGHIPVVKDRLSSVDRAALTLRPNDDTSLFRTLCHYVDFCSDEELECFESVIRQVGSYVAQYVAQYADKIPAPGETATQPSHPPKLPTKARLVVMERMVPEPEFVLQKPKDLAVEDSKWQRLQLLAADAVREAGLDLKSCLYQKAFAAVDRAIERGRLLVSTSGAAAAAPQAPSQTPEPNKAETLAYQDHEHEQG